MKNQNVIIPDEKQERKVKVTELEVKPFSCVEFPDGSKKISIGQSIVCPKNYKTIKEMNDELKRTNWDLVINTTALIIDEINKHKKTKK